MCSNNIRPAVLAHNKIVTDHCERTTIEKISGFDLLNPVIRQVPETIRKLKDFKKKIKNDRAQMIKKLKLACRERLETTSFETLLPVCPLAALRQLVYPQLG
jgi:hypothetical protein